MISLCTAHPSSVGESHPQDCRFALRFGARMTMGGLAATVHALFRFLFVITASRTLDELDALRVGSVLPSIPPER